MEDLLSPEEVATKLKVAKITVYKWVKKGLIPHYRLEKCVRFSSKDVDEFVRKRRVEQGTLHE